MKVGKKRMKSKTINCILLTVFVCAFAFPGIIMTVRARPPQIPFSIECELDFYQIIDDRSSGDMLFYTIAQTWKITDSDLGPYTGSHAVIGGILTLDSIVTGNRKIGDARSTSVLRIISADGTLLEKGRMMATYENYWAPDNIFTKAMYFGNGYVRFRGTTEGGGASTTMTLVGHHYG